LSAWKGRRENVEKAQKLVYKRARFNGLAALGEYREDMERQAA
jgi:fructose-bisphosphate aldolase class 1